MDTLQRFDLAADGFRERLVALGPDDWAARTPCEGWTVADLVDHTIATVRLVADSVGDVDAAPDADALARFDAACADLRRKVADPRLAGERVASPFGELALKPLVSSVVVHDVLVHTWDLARATGGDEELDGELVEHALAAMTPFDAALRGHGFGEKVAPPQGADRQTELLCFLGRTPQP